MSASIDKDPAGEGEDARAVLAGWLDDFSAGKCDRADMQESFLSVCRSNPDAPWDALALLDQYQRRGKIDAALVREFKAEIEQFVFGATNPASGARDGTAVPLDNTGSRWRKLVADRDAETIDTASAADVDAEADEDEEEEKKARTPPPPQRPARANSTPPRFDAEFLPRAAAVKPTSQRVDQPPVDAQGRRVLRDRYELLSVIARGSAGTVYRALDRHRAHLPEGSRCVAVKLLKQSYAARPDLLADLERQFHRAQSLSHPNIVSVFDLDRDGDSYFVVMELLQGMLLMDVLRRLEGQPIAAEKALAVIGGIGAALLYAHRHEVVHGDLKPRNVLVTTDGDVKVIDFGFARHEPLEPETIDALQNELVMAAAAPAYASMERALGDPPQASDDVYSLACMAYELLSGQHPYGGRSGAFGRTQGRRPKRISALTHRQWHALSGALRPAREDRKITLEELLRGLGCLDLRPQSFTPNDLILRESRSGHLVRKAVVALLLFGVSIGGVLYVLRQIDARGPDAPLLPLPSNQRPEAAIEPDTAAGSASDAPQAPSPAEPARATVQGKDERDLQGASRTQTPAAPGATPAAAPARSAVSFSRDTYVVSESDGSVRLIVRRTGAARTQTSFRWMLKGNSAEAGADFAAIGPNRETMAPGVTSIALTIPLVSDAITESTELFQVELMPTEAGATLGELPRASVIIVDDD